MRAITGLLLVLAAACKGGGDDTAASGSPPAIEGRYNVQVNWARGCEGDSSWVEDWANGALSVTGSDNDVTFDYYDGMAFSGSVGVDASYRFGGTVAWGGATLTVSHTGGLTTQDGQRVLDGEFAIEVDDDEFANNNCTVESGVIAYEIVGTN